MGYILLMAVLVGTSFVSWWLFVIGWLAFAVVTYGVAKYDSWYHLKTGTAPLYSWRMELGNILFSFLGPFALLVLILREDDPDPSFRFARMPGELCEKEE